MITDEFFPCRVGLFLDALLQPATANAIEAERYLEARFGLDKAAAEQALVAWI